MLKPVGDGAKMVTRMVLDMNIFEKMSIDSFIKKGYKELSPKFQDLWNTFLARLPAIAESLNLRDEQVYWAKKREMARMLCNDIRLQIHMDTKTKQEIIDTKGNTDDLKRASDMADIYKEYDRKCCHFCVLLDLYMKNAENPANQKPNTKKR